ncbi:MAG: DUF3421 domain-containing protein [Bryobacterales bacterium]|nr:DUF3421 domain-containing protein [Bryobacterales bacterium]
MIRFLPFSRLDFMSGRNRAEVWAMQTILLLTALLAAQTAVGQNWVPGTGAVPPLAVQAGYDLGNVPLYICRTVDQQGTTFAGKFSSNFGCVYYRGAAVAPSSYQVLADYSIDWRSAANGTVPPGSYHAGGGVYICRAFVENSLQVGQVVSGSPGCEIEFGQTGGYFATYEVMYSPWIQAMNGSIPSGAFQGGTDTDGQALYVCRGAVNGVQHLGKIKSGYSACRAGAGNTPLSFNFYEVLTNFAGTWQTYTNTVPPGEAYFAGSSGGVAKYVCRFNVQGTYGLTPGQTGGTDSANECNIEFGNGVKDSGTFQALRRQENPGVCNYTASPLSIVAPGGGTSVTITMTGGCGWVNFPSASWLRPDKRAGTAGSFLLAIDPNPNPSARAGTVVVGGITVNISQAGACSYTIAPNPVTSPASGGTKSISVTTAAGCPWSALTATSWLHLTNSSGTGGGSVIVRIDANPGSQPRNGSIIIAGQTVTVTQDGMIPCWFTPGSVSNIDRNGGSFVFTPSGSGCSTTATGPAWVTITFGPGGQFTAVVQPNPAYVPRSGQITTGSGEPIALSQLGQYCTFANAPATVAVPRSGGSVAIPVSLPSGTCAWSASTSDSFLHIATSSGQGSGYVLLTVDPYQGTSRQGFVALSAYQASASAVITQSDALCNFSASTPAPVPAAGGAAAVTISGGVGCQANFLYPEPWIISPGVVNGPGVYSISVLANPTFASRSQTVKLGPASITLTQQGQPCTVSVSNPPAVPSGGGAFSINVSVASPSCQWTAAETSGFAQLNAPASGTGNGQLTGSLTANPSNSARAATISLTSYLASANATVNQNGTTCEYTIAPLSIQAGAQGGTQTINITAPGGCAWNAIASDTAWISFPSAGSGSGPGSFPVLIAANQSGATRTGSISAGGQSVSITQSAAACVYTLGESGISIPAAGRSGAVTVTTASGCSWSVNSPDSWVVINSPLSNSGPGVAAFTVLANTAFSRRISNLTIAGRSYEIVQAGTSGSGGPGLTFVPLTPCRILETREIYNFEGRTGPFGPPYLNAGETRTLPMTSSNVCSIPGIAKAYVINVTLVPRGAVDFLTVWPAGEPRPNVWSIRSPDGNIVANSAIVKAGTGGGISVYASDKTDAIIDIAGYYTDNDTISNLVYYPLNPCRILDTRIDYRSPEGPFGPPSLAARQARRFRVPATPYCQIPSGAAAYSMTITAVPQGPLQFITVWPGGGLQPNVSSINSPAGRVLANSVIIPAGSEGSIDVYAHNATDFLADISGYYAPDDGVNGQFYFPVTQCRASDSTVNGGIYGDDTARTIAIPDAAGCSGIPISARGYAINVTALPGGSPMPFLSAYPTGQPRPNASVLNAFQGQIVSNSAIVPSGSNGSIDIYAYRRTHVVVEVSGYFGR